MTISTATIPSIIFLHVDSTLTELEPFEIGRELFDKLEIDVGHSFILDVYDSLRQLVDNFIEPLAHSRPNGIGFDEPIPTISPPGTGITPRQIVEHIGHGLPDELLAGISRSLIINSLLIDSTLHMILVVRNLKQIVSFVEQALALGDLIPKFTQNPEHIRAFQILPDTITTPISNQFFPISLQKEYVKPDATPSLVVTALFSILTT